MKRIILFVLFILCFSFCLEGRSIGVWMSYGLQPFRYNFPVKMIVKDLFDLGVTEIYFFEQCGRGGEFLHLTKVKYALTAKFMGNRNFLKELLEETKNYNIKVWLVWTTPTKTGKAKDGMYSLSDIGLNSPELKKVYKEVIDEIAKDYLGEYKNIEGIFWHELDCSEAVDDHKDDLEEFKEFCKRRFNEEYTGTSIPETNPKDKWWRRFYLYRNEIMNTFIKEMAEHSKKYNLKTGFCFYKPESYSGESWKWGYDILNLEKLCDMMWISGYDVEAGKFYQSIKGVVIDFGIGYRSQILPRNYSYAFHGLPLSYFSAFTPVYIEDMRKYYSSIKSFTERYGDIYNGYMGYNEKELSLFYGKENLSNWLKLMSSWQFGETPSKIAVSINPIPFVMLYPSAPGIEYKKKVQSLMESLTGYFDIDGIITGSLNFDLNLKKYPFIIIPEDMALGLKEDTLYKYLSYVKNGGKLLVINTPIQTGKEDLTDIEDKTEKLCGIKIKGKNLPGYISIKGDLPSLPEKKFWAETSNIEPKKAEVMVREKNTDAPLLTRYKIGKGEVFFSAIGFNPEIVPYFASIIKLAVSSPISLEDSKGMRILETTKKGNALCISLWGKGSSILKVDAKILGLKGPFQIKDIVTGRIIKDNVSSDILLKGVPIEIKYLNQPFIVAIGKKGELKVYNGIYQDEEVFKGMTEQRVIENPEVPIMVPAGEGIKVGVYHGGLGSKSIIKVLEKSNFRVFSLPRLDLAALNHADVVIIPQCRSVKFFNQAEEDIRKYVENGGGILLTHDAVGYRGHKPIFSEIGKGITNPERDLVKIIKENEVTAGFKKGETFIPGFRYDHIIIEKGPLGEVVIEDEKGEAVVVIGRIGKGKVVLNGMLPGIFGDKTESGGAGEKEPEGEELKLLINIVKWLGKKEGK